MPSYWYSRFVFERGLALIYLIAFIAVVNQFVPLLGEHGLLPATRFVREVPFRASPSLFFFRATDNAFRLAGWLGVLLSLLAVTGLVVHRSAIGAGVVWALLWVLYLSFVNVGQTFYGFGWESLLLEAGFFTIFAGASGTPPHAALNWIYRWTLFRLMFGAGLIKMRGDSCWRDLTCLDYYFETQPIPNPLSWYFHWLPRRVLHGGVVFNHFVELIVPFGYFLPQPFAGIAGLITIVFQLTLIVSGNLSWLNWLTLVLAVTTLDDRFLSWLPVHMPSLDPPAAAQRIAVYVLAALVAVLSIPPILNMLSPGQLMNSAFNPLQIVNTYGAFGSITKERFEIAIEGTSDESLTERTVWREYEFKGKPGDPGRRPAQIAPYHLRLDWLMWFAAMGSAQDEPWFSELILKLLLGDRATLGLLRANPFPEAPPRWVRAGMYRYHFTTPAERRATGRWWNRERVGEYFPAVRLPAR
ncbi:MAG TPA: lipase maturation factor family protein [Vicinamibacterales bacterium]|nr:lipase maturation factor family protein [Vicinamibacterales bacterium]